MRIRDIVHISIENFKNRKSRTFLTILGVGVGIGAVLFLVSLGYGLQNILLERITTAESFLTLDIASSESRIVALNNDTLGKVARLENVEKVSPQAVFKGQVSYAGLTSETDLNLIDANFLPLNGVLPTLGNIFTEDDSNKIVVNSRIAELFNLSTQDILGKSFTFQFFVPKKSEEGVDEIEVVDVKKEFTAVGVIEDSDSASQVYMAGKDVPEIAIKVQFMGVVESRAALAPWMTPIMGFSANKNEYFPAMEAG